MDVLGAGVCSYGRLAAMHGAVSSFLSAKQVDEDACIALRCDNNLPSAIAVLSLLRHGAGVALCGPSQAPAPFCRYEVECDSSDFGTASRSAVSTWLQVRDNPAWQPAEVSYRRRLYVRTSGTTTNAKTVLFTHEKLWANARNCVDRFRLRSHDRVTIPVPICHMYGLAAALLPAVLAEAAIDIQANSNVIRFLQRESEFAPTTVYLTPGFCYALVRLRQATRRYRLTVSAGDRTSPEIFRHYEDAHGCTVSLYGSTELGAVAAGSPDDAFQVRCHSTGRLMPGVRVSGAGTADKVPDDSDGEHCCAGPGHDLCFDHPAGGEGYVDDRGEVIEADGRFRAGRLRSHDTGRLGEDGYLRIAGRSDHLVKRDGRLVAFSDVELALLKNDIVEAAVVLSDHMTPRGAGLTAICVARRGSADAIALRNAARQHLPAHAVPDRLVLIDAIPRLESGKPDRAALALYVAAMIDNRPCPTS